MNVYNDNFDFRAETLNELKQNIKGFILIPLYHDVDVYDNVILDTQMICEEFERTVYGIESVIETVQDKHYDMLHSEDTDH